MYCLYVRKGRIDEERSTLLVLLPGMQTTVRTVPRRRSKIDILLRFDEIESIFLEKINERGVLPSEVPSDNGIKFQVSQFSQVPAVPESRMDW